MFIFLIVSRYMDNFLKDKKQRGLSERNKKICGFEILESFTNIMIKVKSVKK